MARRKSILSSDCDLIEESQSGSFAGYRPVFRLICGDKCVFYHPSPQTFLVKPSKLTIDLIVKEAVDVLSECPYGMDFVDDIEVVRRLFAKSFRKIKYE